MRSLASRSCSRCIGGGVASAIARAIGAGRMDDTDALSLHALVFAVIFGLLFTVTTVGGGSWLYGALGGSGAALTAETPPLAKRVPQR
jgi:Na+-driven multidrug efflux pump